MTTLTIITDSADIARHEANVKRFLADSLNQTVFAAFADAAIDEDLTDDEIIALVAEVFGLNYLDAIERLAQIDFAASRAEVMP